MKKECILVMGFRHLHIGKNFTSKRKYINIQVDFHLIQNLNPIGIKISNQFVCCYLINPIKNGIKFFHMSRKKKRKPFFNKKMKIFFITKKKKKNNKRFFLFYFQKNKLLLYIDTFFVFEKKEKVFTLNSNTYYLIYNFFFLILSKNIFGELV